MVQLEVFLSFATLRYCYTPIVRTDAKMLMLIVCVRACVDMHLIDGSADKLGWMSRVCVCVWHTPTRPEGQGKRSAAPPAGGAVSPGRRVQQANRGVPVHPSTQTPLHPTVLQDGWGVVETLCSSKPPLMHNSWTSSNFDILLGGVRNFKIKFHNSLRTRPINSALFSLFSFRVKLSHRQD